MTEDLFAGLIWGISVAVLWLVAGGPGWLIAGLVVFVAAWTSYRWGWNDSR